MTDLERGKDYDIRTEGNVIYLLKPLKLKYAPWTEWNASDTYHGNTSWFDSWKSLTPKL